MAVRNTMRVLTVLLAGAVLSTGAFASGGGGVLTDPGAAKGIHFDPKGKQPSEFTIELQNKRREMLPFEDQRDFEESKRGFVAAPDYKQIVV